MEVRLGGWRYGRADEVGQVWLVWAKSDGLGHETTSSRVPAVSLSLR